MSRLAVVIRDSASYRPDSMLPLIPANFGQRASRRVGTIRPNPPLNPHLVTGYGCEASISLEAISPCPLPRRGGYDRRVRRRTMIAPIPVSVRIVASPVNMAADDPVAANVDTASSFADVGEAESSLVRVSATVMTIR